jgi:hypothetical protein
MGGIPVPRTGVMIIRAWMEGDNPNSFRARITYTFDVTGNEQFASATASSADVESALRAWLDALMKTRSGPVDAADEGS